VQLTEPNRSELNLPTYLLTLLLTNLLIYYLAYICKTDP